MYIEIHKMTFPGLVNYTSIINIIISIFYLYKTILRTSYYP